MWLGDVWLEYSACNSKGTGTAWRHAISISYNTPSSVLARILYVYRDILETLKFGEIARNAYFLFGSFKFGESQI